MSERIVYAIKSATSDIDLAKIIEIDSKDNHVVCYLCLTCPTWRINDKLELGSWHTWWDTWRVVEHLHRHQELNHRVEQAIFDRLHTEITQEIIMDLTN